MCAQRLSSHVAPLIVCRAAPSMVGLLCVLPQSKNARAIPSGLCIGCLESPLVNGNVSFSWSLACCHHALGFLPSFSSSHQELNRTPNVIGFSDSFRKCVLTFPAGRVPGTVWQEGSWIGASSLPSGHGV